VPRNRRACHRIPELKSHTNALFYKPLQATSPSAGPSEPPHPPPHVMSTERTPSARPCVIPTERSERRDANTPAPSELLVGLTPSKDTNGRHEPAVSCSTLVVVDPSSPVSPEMDVTLQCVRTVIRRRRATSEPEPFILKLDPVIDWDRFITLGRTNGVLPLIYESLTSMDPPSRERIPHDVADNLHAFYLLNTAHNMRLAHAMHEVAGFLSDHGFEALPIKGIVLAMCAHGDIASRQMCDVDLLMPESHILRAVEVLSEAGYHRHRPSPDFTPSQTRAYLRSRQDWCLTGEHGVSLDIKPSLTTPCHSRERDLIATFQRKTRMSIDGREIDAPSLVDTLIISCIHATYDLWGRLSLITDIAGIISSHPESNWEDVLSTAQEAGHLRILCIGAHLAESIVDVALPEPLARTIASDPHTRVLASRAARAVLSGHVEPAGWSNWRFQAASRERWPDKLFFLTRQLFVPSHLDWKWIRLPGALSPAYRLLRPLRLALSRKPQEPEPDA
jgi:hypothetical protein